MNMLRTCMVGACAAARFRTQISTTNYFHLRRTMEVDCLGLLCVRKLACEPSVLTCDSVRIGLTLVAGTRDPDRDFHKLKSTLREAQDDG